MNEAGAVPTGLHNRSYDSEIIPFLSHHVKNPQLALPDKISHSNLYGEDEPWKLPFKNNNDGTRLLSEGDDVLYIITKLENKSESRIKRTAGSGVWKGQTKGKKIKSFIEGKEEEIGLKKTFSFGLKKNEASLSNHMKEWHYNMQEFSLSGHSLIGLLDPHSKETVLCRIRRKRPHGYKEEGSLGHDRVADEEARKKRRTELDEASQLPNVTLPLVTGSSQLEATLPCDDQFEYNFFNAPLNSPTDLLFDDSCIEAFFSESGE